MLPARNQSARSNRVYQTRRYEGIDRAAPSRDEDIFAPSRAGEVIECTSAVGAAVEALEGVSVGEGAHERGQCTYPQRAVHAPPTRLHTCRNREEPMETKDGDRDGCDKDCNLAVRG